MTQTGREPTLLEEIEAEEEARRVQKDAELKRAGFNENSSGAKLQGMVLDKKFSTKVVQGPTTPKKKR